MIDLVYAEPPPPQYTIAKALGFEVNLHTFIDLFCLLHEMTNPKQKSYDTSENLIYDTSD